MSDTIGEFYPIEGLTPHPKNPRQNDEAVSQIARSIERFGFTSPIIAREQDKTIIAGHTRWKAAQKIGLSKVPVIFVNLSVVDAELLMIADNKLGEKADWDTDKLSELLTELREQGEDLDVLGFDDGELEDLLDSLDDYGIEQEAPPPAVEPDPVESDLDFTLLKGDCLQKLKELPDNSIDAIVTDPPYELGFMGKSWDSTGIAYSVALWKECLRVLKYGGHLVAFSGSRTVFPMGVAIADAGFEVRDMISWIYTSGFPKSLDISKAIDKKLGLEPIIVGKRTDGRYAHSFQETNNHMGKLNPTISNVDKIGLITEPASPQAQKWQGWGTALKPAQEPAVLARKPIDPECNNIAENVLKWGTGAINIDAGRFPYGDDCHFGNYDPPRSEKVRPRCGSNEFGKVLSNIGMINYEVSKLGRWPANVYQCSKPQRSEKEQGLDHLTGKTGAEATQRKEGSDGLNSPRAGAGRTAEHVKNFHPTVKPIKLMRWLCRLLTPKGGVVLDPFLGSGTTAVSAILEGYNAVGCEMTEDYYPIIQGRVNWAKSEREKQISGESE